MSRRPIIDAGPALNFLACNKERLLVSVLGKLSAPEIVQDEVLRKAAQDARFRAAAAVWRRMTPKWIEILSDSQTPELAAVVNRIAVVAAEAGANVIVLIDDGGGARIATNEIGRLQRLRAVGCPVGAIRFVRTTTVLQRAAGTPQLPNKLAMRETYARLRTLDDGLPPIENTGLLKSSVWL